MRCSYDESACGSPIQAKAPFETRFLERNTEGVRHRCGSSHLAIERGAGAARGARAEIRFLANRDANLHFALLTDLPDSTQQFDEKSAGLDALCSDLIEELNRKYAHELK